MTPIPAWVVFRSQAGAPFWIEPVPLPLPVPEWISVLAMFNSSVESGRRDEASGIGYFLPAGVMFRARARTRARARGALGFCPLDSNATMAAWHCVWPWMGGN